jgi:mRNA interferase HigB
LQGKSVDNSQYVKYYQCVQIGTRKHLEEAMEAHKDAADELKKWRRTVKAARWRRFEEVRSIFTDADDGNDYVIFNIRGNRYRLVTVIHYVKVVGGKQPQGHVYIRSFLTHKEYDNPDNWDRKYGKKKQ